jgi:hypothetical protein
MEKHALRGVVVAILAYVLLQSQFLVTKQVIETKEAQASPPAQASVGGHTINPHLNNPNAGVIGELKYRDITCKDKYYEMQHLSPFAGYGTFFLKQDRTRVVGDDPRTAMKFHIYEARPGSVKPCVEQIDETDCICDVLSGLCSAEATRWGASIIVNDLQDPRMARHRTKRKSLDAVYGQFEVLCRDGG